MRILISVLLLLGVALTGCKSTSKAEKEKKAALSKKTKAALREDTDIDFEAFVGRLKKAVAARDLTALATMMTPDFGYSLKPERSGDGVFKYWDDQNLWPELNGI